tara:strand:- start:657 stop:2039 length:1383 start_codon:yes stop_codon:yes gene_type:complete
VEHKILVKKIFKEVINPGNCFHCGLCEGLSKNLFKMNKSLNRPIPKLIRKPTLKDVKDLRKIVHSCPGRGFPYNYLSNKINSSKKNKLIGNYNNLLIASSNNKKIREKSSSGGVVRTLLIELINSKKVDYVCVLDKKKNKVLDFDILVTKNIDEILNISQSIYQTTPLLHRLKDLKKNKKYVFVGLPEHIAALRVLKMSYPKEFNHIKFLISIYSGTNMYPGAIEFYLKGNGIKNLREVRKIDWRYGEWPGKLRIITKSNKVLSLKKFYYNYLIPFFISKNCLITPDFTGELSDISVGDAWSSKLESKGYGYSVVISRSEKLDKIINNLKKKNILSLKNLNLENTVKMHAHMLEFKKVGSYLRIEKLKKNGPVPLYDLKPTDVPFLRRSIESMIGLIISTASNNFIKSFFSIIGSSFMGYLFQLLRKFWKFLTKTTKRKGLKNIKFTKVSNSRLNEFFSR